MVSCSGVLKKIAERYSEGGLCQCKRNDMRGLVLTRSCVRTLSVDGRRVVGPVEVLWIESRVYPCTVFKDTEITAHRQARRM